MYGSRYVRFAAGDPGFFSGLVKTVAKVAAPVTKVVGAVSKVPVIGKVASMIPGVGTVITGASLAGTALGALSKTKAGAAGLAAARSMFGGSKVTQGPLTLGGKNLLPSRPGLGLVAGGGSALAAGVGGVAAGRALVGGGKKRKRRTAAAAAGAGRRRARAAGAAAPGRCGCPKGTRRVCFKSRRASGGTRTAAQRRFAAAARRHRGRIPKGARL